MYNLGKFLKGGGLGNRCGELNLNRSSKSTFLFILESRGGGGGAFCVWLGGWKILKSLDTTFVNYCYLVSYRWRCSVRPVHRHLRRRHWGRWRRRVVRRLDGVLGRRGVHVACAARRMRRWEGRRRRRHLRRRRVRSSVVRPRFGQVEGGPAQLLRYVPDAYRFQRLRVRWLGRRRTGALHAVRPVHWFTVYCQLLRFVRKGTWQISMYFAHRVAPIKWVWQRLNDS